MGSIGILLGVISGLATLGLLFKPIFGSMKEFGECVHYWMMPDIFSWISGEGLDDFFAELKLGAWCLGGLAVRVGVNVLVSSF